MLIYTASQSPPETILATMLHRTVQRNSINKWFKEVLSRKDLCWKSIRETLKVVLNRKGFQKSCEAWRNRTFIHEPLGDVHDGRVWKNFKI